MFRRWVALAAVMLGVAGAGVSVPAAATLPSAGRLPVPPAVVAAQAATAPVPVFVSSVRSVTVDELGATWRKGCPVGASKLSAVSVTHWDFAGRVRTGEIVVASSVVDDVVAAFAAAFETRFPITQVASANVTAGDDIELMRRNITSGFNCRTVVGFPKVLSPHAYGRAIDVNPRYNPYQVSPGVVHPDNGRVWLTNRSVPGALRLDSAMVSTLRNRGWCWGGTWRNPDLHHFQRSSSNPRC